MKCSCCDRFLSDYESTLRHAVTMEFLDTCTKCLEGLDIPTLGRPDLENTVEQEDYFDEEEDSEF